MNKVIKLVFCAFVAAQVSAFSLEADAREFYRVTERMDISYTNIQNGAVGVLDNVPIEVRYSDDAVFCEVRVAAAILPCENFNQPVLEVPDVKISMQTWLKLFQALEAAGSLNASYMQKLTRILNFKMSKGTQIGKLMDYVYYNRRFQVDDDVVTEAFHLTFAITQKSTRM